MSEASGADYLDRLLGGGGAVLIKEGGVALPAPVDKINLVGDIEVAYTPPESGQKYGEATVTVTGTKGDAGQRGSRWYSTSGVPTFAGLQYDRAFDGATGIVYVCTSDGVNWDVDGELHGEIGNPVALLVGASNSAGSGTQLAAANHVHGVTRGIPAGIGTANSAGVAQYFAGSDHVHALTFAVLKTVLEAASSSIGVNGQKITGGATPTADTDYVIKSYVDAIAQGFVVRDPVNAFIPYLAAASMTGLGTFDGVALTNNMRVLVATSDVPAKAGPWVVHSGAWTRPTDYAAGSDAKGAAFLVFSGTTYGASSWVAAASTGTYVVDTDGVTFRQFAMATAIGAGNGLTKTGSTLDVVCDDSSISVLPNAIRVASVAWSLLTGVPSTFTPSYHAASHLTGGDQIGYPSNTKAGLMRPVDSANSVYVSNSAGTAVLLAKLTNSHFSNTANIDPNRLAKGAANQVSVFVSDGNNNYLADPAGWGLATPSELLFDAWHDAVTIGSGTYYLVGTSATFADVTRANQVWQIDIEAEVAIRRSSDASVTGRLKGRMLLNVSYASDGTPSFKRVAYHQPGDLLNDTTAKAQNNEQGLPALSDVYFGTVGSAVTISLSKNSGGNECKARARFRKSTELRLDTW